MRLLVRGVNIAQAHLIVAALEAEGIRAHVQGEFGGAALEGVASVFVIRDEDVDEALALVRALEDRSP